MNRTNYAQSLLSNGGIDMSKGEKEIKECHFTAQGVSPNLLGGYNFNTKAYEIMEHILRDALLKALQTHEVVWVHGGCSLGTETMLARAYFSIKPEYEDRLFLHAHIPSMNQTKNWRRKRCIGFWSKQVQEANKVTIYANEFLGEGLSEQQLYSLRDSSILSKVDTGYFIYPNKEDMPEQSEKVKNGLFVNAYLFFDKHTKTSK